MPIPDPFGGLGSLLGSGAKSLAGDAFQSIAEDFSKAAGAVSSWLWKEIGSSTAVQLGGSGFDRILAIVMGIAVVVGMGLFLVQIITSVLRRDTAGLARAAKGLLVAFLGGAAAIAVTNILLTAVDALSNGVVQAATGGNVSQLGNGIMGTAAWDSLTNPAAMLILALIVIAAVVFIWAALMVRKLLIIVAAVFAPAAFAGSLADISTGWVKKWIEGMAALIASKLILVITLVIGYYVLTRNLGAVGAGGVPGSNPTGTQAVTQVATGGLILLLGGFAPWVAIKTVHFAGDHMAELHAHAGSATAGASTVIAAPQKLSSMAAQGKGMVAGRSGGPGPTGPGWRSQRRWLSPLGQVDLRGPVRAQPAQAQPAQARPARIPPGLGSALLLPSPPPSASPRLRARQQRLPQSTASRTPTATSQATTLVQGRPSLHLLLCPPTQAEAVTTPVELAIRKGLLPCPPPPSTPGPSMVRFGRRSTRGVILGFSLARAVTLAAAIVVMILSLVVAGGVGFVVSALLWAPLVASAFVTVRGKPAIEWAPTAGHYAFRKVTGQTEFRAKPSKLRPAGTLALPGDAASLRFYDDPATGCVMVHDPHRQTLSGVLAVEHPAYVLLSPDQQAQRVSAWGRTLASLAQSGTCAAVQVLEATVPDPGTGVAGWYDHHGTHDGGWADGEYRELLAQSTTGSSMHRTTVTIALDMKRAGKAIRDAGRGMKGAAAVLSADMVAIEHGLPRLRPPGRALAIW